MFYSYLRYFCYCILCSIFPSHAALLIYAGQLIDVENKKALSKQTIIVQGDRILDVKSGYIIPNTSDTTLNLKNKTVLPGLMDMHTHITFQMSNNTYLDPYILDPADLAIIGTKYARLTLLAGFTTIRDLGGSYNVSINIRNNIEKGHIIGPRIYTCGTSIGSTGGHSDPTNGRNRELISDPGPKQGIINGPEDARKAVRQRYKEGADVIKITATGGVLSFARSGDNAQLTKDELQAIVTTANDYNFTVAVHAHGKKGMKRAILAGVTSIEHATYMDEEIIKLMKAKKTYYTPTLSAGLEVARKAMLPNFFPEMIRVKAARIGPRVIKTFKMALAHQLNIVFGTDSGVYPHGENWKEFRYMVDAGMAPIDAIVSATLTPAQMLRIDNKLGSITPGKLADLIAVDGDPLQDITVMGRVSMVMKDGKIEK